MSLATFTRFADLPEELKLRIWEIAAEPESGKKFGLSNAFALQTKTPRFTERPLRLYLQKCGFALGLLSHPLPLSSDFYSHVSDTYACVKAGIEMFTAFIRVASVVGLYGARLAMMGTAYLPRRIALLAWQRDLKNVVEGHGPNCMRRWISEDVQTRLA